jgi:lysophospholipase L1-like esterase
MKMPGHLALLGDSIFANRAYVSGPEVAALVRVALPGDWEVTLLAQDGAMLSDIRVQLSRLPPNVTHLVISAGGNDALRQAMRLQERVETVWEAVFRLAKAREQFWQDYRLMLDLAQRARLPVAVATIYDPRFPEPEWRLAGATALAVLNDCITREAVTRQLSLIDLRVICNDDIDFATAIEPSVRGGTKIARAIAELVRDGEASGQRAA